MIDSIDNKSVLLHACCGPCAEWPLKVLPEEGLSVSVFFFNPNIHPKFEWERRKSNLELLTQNKGIEIIVDYGYEEDLWINNAWKDKYESRCHMCYDIRMKKVAREAKARGFSAFTTTLLVSIYQKHELIVESANRASAEFGIPFLYHDFRDGFRKGQQMAREDNLYRQKYCGCIQSLEESKFKNEIYGSFSGSVAGTDKVL
jgi:hypothetical protein